MCRVVSIMDSRSVTPILLDWREGQLYSDYCVLYEWYLGVSRKESIYEVEGHVDVQ